jgi:hypothetical protein
MTQFSSDISSPSGCKDLSRCQVSSTAMSLLGFPTKTFAGHHAFQSGALPSLTKEPDDWENSGILLCSSSSARPALMPRPWPCDSSPLGGQVQMPDAKTVSS